ncbi:MAG: hypothetical protein ABEN55_06405 [Bradymonadaceae bacterium]
MSNTNELPSIYSTIADHIADWHPTDGPLRWSDRRFDRLARAVFRHQFAENAPYRDFCKRRGVDPSSLSSYRQIPAVATEVFKRTDLTCGGPTERVFRTSGTTTGDRGRHLFRTLALYRRAIHPPFRRFCNPEATTRRMGVVAPAPDQLPDSSLSFMLGELVDRWGDAKSDFFARADETGDLQFDFDGLADFLETAVDEETAVLLFGTVFGFAEFFDATDADWQLPTGSRVVETGGFKGRTEELTKSDLYDQFVDRLGIARRRCLSEYSMTELSSQAYTATLVRESAAARRPEERGFYPPPWARIEIVDPETLELTEETDRTGLIRWYDLANVGSVCAVQTADLGYRTREGSVVHEGRAREAPLRGCSLTAEEITDGKDPSTAG